MLIIGGWRRDKEEKVGEKGQSGEKRRNDERKRGEEYKRDGYRKSKDE